MIYKGQSITVTKTNEIAFLVFANNQASVNKFDQNTLEELDKAIKAIISTENG